MDIKNHIAVSGLIFVACFFITGNYAFVFVSAMFSIELLYINYHKQVFRWWNRKFKPGFYSTIRKIRFAIFGTPPIMEQLKKAMWKAGYSHFTIRKNTQYSGMYYPYYRLFVDQELKMVDKYDGWLSGEHPSHWVVPEQLGIACGCGSNYHHDIKDIEGIEEGTFYNPKRTKGVMNEQTT